MPKKPWFPHDLDASSDRKLVILAMERGYCAVGRWWNLVEYLTGLDGYCMEIDEMTPAALAKRWTTPLEPCSTTDATDLLDAFVTRYRLLKRTGSHVWSDSLMRRMDEYNAAINRFSKAGKASADARLKKYGSSLPKNAPNVVRRTAERRSKAHRTLPPNVVRTSAEPFLPSSLPTGEEGLKSPPPPVLPTSGLVLRAPEETPVSKPNEKADGAAGALNGAAARPEEDEMPSDTPSPPEPMRPEHLAELQKRAATGDKFALEALRRARHDGRLPHLPHPPAGSSTAPAPISPAGEKAGAPVEPERAQCDDVFADDEVGGDDDARD